MDSPQMYDTQHGQATGVMSAADAMKKAPGTQASNNNNAAANANNNNNNLTTLNNNTGTTKQTAALLKQHHLAQQYQQHGPGGDLSDLNTPEISLDLQNLIDDSQFGDGLFSDILAQNPGVAAAGKHGIQGLHAGANRQLMQASSTRYPSTTLAYMPQPVHSGAGAAGSYTAGGGPAGGQNSDSNSSMDSDVPSIKEEPVDPQEYRRQCAAAGYMPGQYGSGAPNFATLAPGGVLHHQPHQLQGLGGGGHGALPGMKSIRNGGSMGHHPHSHGHHSPGGSSRKSMKPTDKSSDEYRRRRERNNIAVRKSREKAKVRTRETEEKVKLLVKENERLQKRIELLTEELNVLRSLFSNVGVLPEHLHREINKHLDSFQLQHQQQQQHMSEDRRVLDILQEYGP